MPLAAACAALGCAALLSWPAQASALDTAAPTDPEAIREADRRLAAAFDQFIVSSTVEQCDAVGRSVEDILSWRVSESAFLVENQRAHCRLSLQPVSQLRIEQIDAALQPLIDRFERAAQLQQDHGRLAARAHESYWKSLRMAGHNAQADALESAAVERWLSLRNDARLGAQMMARLRVFAVSWYGASYLTQPMLRWHARFVDVLGESHPLTMVLLQSRIFNLRQLRRPAEALALSEEYIRLRDRDHPGNERMLAGIRSERSPALQALGRIADAFDEGRLLLEWHQRQEPRQFVNLMRAAYNLSMIAHEMADLEAAQAYARISLEAAEQIGAEAARSEIRVPRLLLHHARFLRGEPGADDDLQQALTGLVTDPSVLRAMLDLGVRAAVLPPGPQREARLRLFQQHVGSLYHAGHPERALPGWLDLRALPSGDAQALQQAPQLLAQALTRSEPEVPAVTAFEWARHLAPRQPDAAIWLYKRGASAVVRMRDPVAEAAPERQGAWMQRFDSDLRDFIGLLIDEGRLVEAERAIEVLREEELAEFRRRSRGQPLLRLSRPRTGAPALALTPDERAREAAVVDATAALQAEARAFDLRVSQDTRMGGRVSATDSQLAARHAELAQALQQAVDQPARAGRPTAGPRDLPAPVALPPGVARLSAFQRKDRLELVLQKGSHLQRVSVPVDAVTLNREIQQLRGALSRPAGDRPEVLQRLHRWLIAPLKAPLTGVRELRLALDGALRYVPYAALHDGRRYLVETLVLSSEIAGGAVRDDGAFARAPAPAAPVERGTLSLAAFGRTLPDVQHAALPGVRQELAVLQALRGAAVQTRLDEGFDAEALQRSLASGPRVVHLASHFVLDPAGEETSYLLLGSGGRLSLRALRQMPWNQVELAVLSACDSGLSLNGVSSAQGQEIAGFAASLRAAGVRHVMATLWRVDDQATAQWMAAFYRPWQRPGALVPLGPQRLAQAQRQWIRQQRGTPLAHPYYWAGFSWMGA